MPISAANTFSVTYRARGYDADDALSLRGELAELGAVRLRPLRLPEAGGSHEIWIVLEFVGTAIAGGLIQHLTAKYYERLSAALSGFFTRKKAKDFEPEMSLRVSYDDVDLDIGPISEKGISTLPELAEHVHAHLNSPGLKDKSVTRVVIGMVREAERWEEPHLQLWPESSRFWGLSFEDHRYVTHIYDTETGLLADRPDSDGHPTVG